MYKEPQPIVIKVKRDDNEEIEIKMNWDAGGDKWKDAFKTILYWASFGNDTIESIFNETYLNDDSEEKDEWVSDNK